MRMSSVPPSSFFSRVTVMASVAPMMVGTVCCCCHRRTNPNPVHDRFRDRPEDPWHACNNARRLHHPKPLLY